MVFNSISAAYCLFTALHLTLLALAAVTAGLYGADLARGEQPGGAGDGRWAFAVVVAGLSAATAMLYLIPPVLRFMAVWIWDIVLFILWIVVFGVFAKSYIHEPAGGDAATRRMKAAVWIDLASALLWLIAAVAAWAYWRRHKERRTRFTGRAKIY